MQATANGLLPHQDKIWRVNNLFKIRSKTGIQRFKLNPLQIKILEDCRGMNPIRHISIKTRQIGVSTLWILYWLDDTLFRKGVISGIMAHEQDSLQHLSSIVKFALSNLSHSVNLSEDNQKRISFQYNDSTMLIDLDFRSTPLHNLHISEWCFCKNENIWATLGATNKWSNISGESTGNGIGNDGYETYMDAVEGKNEYRSRFIAWYEHNEYRIPLNGGPLFIPDKREKRFGLDQEQIHYRRQMMNKLKQSFFVEYPETPEDAFASSGISFFENRKVIVLATEARKLETEYSALETTNEYSIWEKRDKTHVYVMGADVAEGLDGDYSTFKILCVTCRQEVMSYRAHCGIDAFYRVIAHYGHIYNDCLVAVERNNHGHAVILGLREQCAYPHLYYENPKRTKLITNTIKPEPRYGWPTTVTTKTPMLDQLKVAIEGDSEEDENTFQPEFTVRDLNFLSECLTFQSDGTKLGAIVGKHDDLVIATGIAFQMYLREKRKMIIRKPSSVMLGEKRVFTS